MNTSGLGQPGARTTEKKDWLTTIKKGVILTIVIWVGLCMIWLLSYTSVWLIYPHSDVVYWFEQHPRVWFAIPLLLGIPCMIGMIVWARQELLDEDWTSLQGKHELSGIMPMTPLVRLVLFWQWLRGRNLDDRGDDDDW